MNKKPFIYFLLIAIFLVVASVFLFFIKGMNIKSSDNPPRGNQNKNVSVSNFEECAALTGVILESYPPQCVYRGRTFVQDIGNVLDKEDLIHIDNPRPNDIVSSPLTVIGSARGTWYFEGDFPVRLFDENNNSLSVGVAAAKGEWMTEGFVPFEVTLTFEVPKTKKGFLILQRDNPSGLPEQSDELRVPVIFY